MNNLEKLTQAGQIVFGEQWQSPMSRLLGVDSRSVRNYVSGKSRPPYSRKLRESLEQKAAEIQQAIALVDADMVSGDDVTIDAISNIVSQYDYSDIQYQKAAVDEINNAVYPKTYLSDLHQIAMKWAGK
ncbi:hypothetical protein SOASR015_35920 [Pectobacterium carotovorum subsp. carotovorum]|nr:hypothetical protein SOASR015_35920 [Pectobacterium carotovorum subsp. carotovorum]GLX58413.1 hypothetical protein Pcaca02_37220 [Pectobacterium carotovorum subsp. carotovorum]